MTYNVFGRTLNLAQSIKPVLTITIATIALHALVDKYRRKDVMECKRCGVVGVQGGLARHALRSMPVTVRPVSTTARVYRMTSTMTTPSRCFAVSVPMGSGARRVS